MKTCSTTKPLPIEEQVPAFEKDLANADTMRAATLSRLHGLLASKASHTEREQKLMAATLGEDHPDVVTLKAEVAAGQSFVRELRAEGDRAATGTLVADKRSWILHGFVRNQALEGQPNLTVAMFDSTNRWVEALGHTCTDDRGYFQLCFVPGKEVALEQGRELFVHISDPKQKELYRDKNPMLAVLGETKYREIIIGEETTVCSPPSSPQKPGASTASSAEPAKKTRTTKKAPKSKKA